MEKEYVINSEDIRKTHCGSLGDMLCRRISHCIECPLNKDDEDCCQSDEWLLNNIEKVIIVLK